MWSRQLLALLAQFQLGRKGGRKRQKTASKIKSAKKLLASGVPHET
jgi:hypothetical protein